MSDKDKNTGINSSLIQFHEFKSIQWLGTQTFSEFLILLSLQTWLNQIKQEECNCKDPLKSIILVIRPAQQALFLCIERETKEKPAFETNLNLVAETVEIISKYVRSQVQSGLLAKNQNKNMLLYLNYHSPKFLLTPLKLNKSLIKSEIILILEYSILLITTTTKEILLLKLLFCPAIVNFYPGDRTKPIY